jgi:flagellar motility protein MotE (MotC chaperone)
MKNILVLAVVAVVLFSISAGLSVWLNQNRATTLPTEKEKAQPVINKEPDKDKDKTPGKGPPKTDGSALPDPGLRLNDAEDRLRRRESQMDLVLRDLAGERQAVDELVRQVTAATKQVADEPPPAPKTPAAVPKGGAPDAEAGADKKGIDQLSRLYAAMPPDSAATILKKMADGGQLDTSVRILAAMQERQAAQILAAISLSDDGLAAQITQRIRMLRRPTPAGAGGNLAPAGGTGPLGRTPP